MVTLVKRIQAYTSDLFTVYKDEVVLPTGRKRIYQNVIRKPAVTVFPIDNDYNLYLIKQQRYLIEKELLEAVAGLIDGSEKPFEAAKRELKEETGIEAQNWEPLGVHVAAGSIATWNQYLFIAEKLRFGKQNLEESEEIQVVKINIAEAVNKVLSGEINCGSTPFGILMIDQLRKEGRI